MFIELTPETDTNVTNENHTVNATITDSDGQEQEGIEVIFEVISGPGEGTNGTNSTDANGMAQFTYTSSVTGTDVIQACYENNASQRICSQTVTKVWNGETQYEISLDPEYDLNLVGEKHTVNANINGTGDLSEISVAFRVISGPHAGPLGFNATDENGTAVFTYQGVNGTGKDQIQACFRIPLREPSSKLRKIPPSPPPREEVCSEIVEKEWTEETIFLTPLQAQNPLNSSHQVNATVQDLKGYPLEGIDVTFEVVSGPHAGESKNATTDVNGTASFTYTGDMNGTDVIQACFTNALGEKVCTDKGLTVGKSAVKVWGDACPGIDVDPNLEELSSGTVGTFYEQVIKDTNSNGTQFLITEGSLPDGLEGEQGSFRIFGTPTQPGTWTFTLSAFTYDDPCIEEKKYTIRIQDAPPPEAAQPVPTMSEWGMMLMALILAVCSIRYLRRRHG